MGAATKDSACYWEMTPYPSIGAGSADIIVIDRPDRPQQNEITKMKSASSATRRREQVA
jgi:hypothetical protein